MTTVEQSVEDGRAQADRLRPLGITRAPNSPRTVVPDPTPEQLKALAREQNGDLAHVRGVAYPNGTLVIERRMYVKAAPWSRTAVTPTGRATFTMINAGAVYGSPSRSWRVIRGQRGKVVLRNVHEYDARRVLSGRIKPEEVTS